LHGHGRFTPRLAQYQRRAGPERVAPHPTGSYRRNHSPRRTQLPRSETPESSSMKIRKVEAVVLESPYENKPPEGSEEAHGVKHCLLIKVSTDEGITGWSDVETAPHVGVAVIDAPESGAGVFEGLRTLVIGEDPFEVERLWDKIYR